MRDIEMRICIMEGRKNWMKNEGMISSGQLIAERRIEACVTQYTGFEMLTILPS